MSVRKARLRAPAKINLDLRVLGRRADGYHELRTLFQTISLADVLEIEHEPGAGFTIEVESSEPIEDNLIERAARLLRDRAGLGGRWRVKLEKRIPMGAGLGGGSTDAAAALLAMPVLGGLDVPVETLVEMAAELGSDVPFFLLGGTAVGLGRGSELYPLKDAPRLAGIVAAPGVHVSTAEAYRALGRALTDEAPSSILNSFQCFVWGQDACAPAKPREFGGARNDFEDVVFARHPKLGAIRAAIGREGALAARMSGSGSSVFGLFGSRAERDRALIRLRGILEEGTRLHPIALVGRAAYRALWRRQLRPHGEVEVWPPRSRYCP